MNFPPLPEPMIIPSTIVDRWGELPPNHPAGAMIKAEWEGLFFCLDHMIGANQALQNALVAYSNNNMEAANAQSWEASRRNAEATNKLRVFMTGVMARAAA